MTEQLRSHMNEVLQNEYGVNLNETRNQIVTNSWDRAQEMVCSSYIIDTVKNSMPDLML